MARIDHSSARSLDEALRAGNMGAMTEMRIGGALVFLEMWNLYNKLATEDKRSREYIEAVAALVALSAAGVEVGAITVGFAERSGNAAVQQGAKVFSGGLRLGAGILAGTAGMVGAWYDYADFWEQRKLGRHSVVYFYFFRAVVQTGAAGLSIAVGLAYSSPYIEHLIKKHGTKVVIGKVLVRGSQASAALASRMIPMLRIFFGINLFLIALVAIELFILPDDLENYLNHSTFRKDRNNGIVDTEEREVALMQRAIERTL
ncbi:hypothetical protein [Pseudomonas taiwanensis]|uniref:hypothetical protein n=1 Tax=Pseudomonas taiwanensis TaxID=470150 RepID=UPI0015B8DF4D|nr:hypothetical protein [Pseudomonas taiwanensis]